MAIVLFGTCSCTNVSKISDSVESNMRLPKELQGLQLGYEAQRQNTKLGEMFEFVLDDETVILEKANIESKNLFKVKFFSRELNDTTYAWIEY